MAKLIFRLTPGESLDFPLHMGETQLGRHSDNEIVIDNTWISSHHASFNRTESGIVLKDLGSSNGTSVNGERIEERALQHGDSLAFGQLEASYDAEAEAVVEFVAKSVKALVPVVAGKLQRPAPMVASGLATKHKPTMTPAPVKPGWKPAMVTPGAPMTAAPKVAVPVVAKSVAVPTATVMSDAAREEGRLELEALQKKLEEASAATAKALAERAAAEAALSTIQTTLKTAEATWQETQETTAAAKRAAEAQQLSVQEEAARAEAARETAAAAAQASAAAAEATALAANAAAQTLAELKQEIEKLTTKQQTIHQASVEQETAAKQTGNEAVRALAERNQELKTLQNTLEKNKVAALQIESEAEQAKAALSTAKLALQELEAGTTTAQAAHQQILANRHQEEKALAEVKSEILMLGQEADQHRQEASQRLERNAAVEAELAAMQASLATASRAAQEEASRLAGHRLEIAELTDQHQLLTAKLKAAEHHESAAAALADKKTQRIILTEEATALEARLDYLRRETEGAEALNNKVTDLRQHQAEAERRLEFLTDRLAGMSEAPDPNWGTVHSLARSFIKKLDLIDDLIAHLTEQPEAVNTLEQLQLVRSGLLDILKEYSIESYSLEPGTVIDVAARKRIQIVESLGEGSHDGTLIVRTYRPGYVCLNGDLGISTLLRKADVAVSIALS